MTLTDCNSKNGMSKITTEQGRKYKFEEVENCVTIKSNIDKKTRQWGGDQLAGAPQTQKPPLPLETMKFS